MGGTMRGVLLIIMLPAALAASLMIDPVLYPITAAVAYLVVWWRMRR